MNFVAIESGVEVALPAALASRFQVQPDQAERWCVGLGGAGRSQDEGGSASSMPSGPLSRTPASSSIDSTL
jgi:hypothetical protein